MIANFMSQIGNHTDTTVDEGLFRHMVLNSIRSNRVKFKDYGEIVIACDDKTPWRKTKFSFYKANRKKNRDSSEIDWNNIFNILNKIKTELKEFFPYRVIQVEGAEADDIIATLVMEHGTLLGNNNKIMILSGDKDFKQLQKYSNVEQYDPVNKKFIKEHDPIAQLKEHIIRGDRGDGIPNILSADDCLVNGTRQKPVSKKKIDEWLAKDLETAFTVEELRANYNRNKMLIDLSCIPNYIKERIMIEYHSQDSKSKDKIFGYMINNKMKQLIEHINEF